MITFKLIAEGITALSAGTAAVIAVLGLNAWKKQLRGKNDYELARRYLRASYRIRDAMKSVRNPFIPVEEINNALKERGPDQSRSDQKDATRAVYALRWKKVTEAGSDLELEMREAEVSWGVEALEIERDLEDCIKELFVAIKMFLDVDEIAPKRDIIYDNGEQDEYNKKLKNAVTKIENYLKPHLR